MDSIEVVNATHVLAAKKKHNLNLAVCEVEETAQFYYISPTTTWNKGKSQNENGIKKIGWKILRQLVDK